jgi:hypothetical protein
VRSGAIDSSFGRPSRRTAGSVSLLLLAAALLFLIVAPAAMAGIPEQLSGMPVTESFNGSESSLTNFAAGWAPLGWAGGTAPKGSDATNGWRPVDAYSAVNGTYYTPTFTDAGSGILAAATMATNPGVEARYFSLWLDQQTPAGAKSGYQLTFTDVTSGVYNVTLSKWQAGTQTVLASQASYAFANGNSFALSDLGSAVSAWTDTGTGFKQLLSATDSSFSGGSAGIEGSGNITRLTNFKAGVPGPPPKVPDTSISAGPEGVLVPEATFSFTATEPGSTFECALDTGAYAACSSPMEYQGLAEGTHTFQVRAKDSAGPDETPAARSFQVVSAARAASKVAVLDGLERSEVPLETGKWTRTSWGGEIGGAWMGNYRGFGANSLLASAYWNSTTFGDGAQTVLVAGNVGTGSPGAGEYQALWLDMPSPDSARSGYEARFVGVNGSATNYTVELAKWVSGTRTVLASTSAFSLGVGTRIALTETRGGNLAVWNGMTTLTRVLAAKDSTYTSGYAGIEVNGGAGTINNFRAGRIDVQPPNTSILSGPSGPVLPAIFTFTFSSTESPSTFECSLDGAAFSACATPKVYVGLAAGNHAFRVRALDNVANQDESPAERSFQVIAPPSATTAAATGVRAHEATLNAEVNPHGAVSTYQFEYGATTSYGSKVPATPKAAGSGGETVQVGEALVGLEAGTTYHFRVVATSEAGTTNGADRTFTTTSAPAAASKAASALAASEATLNAEVNPHGAATTYQFEYGTTTSYGSRAPATPESAGSGTAVMSVSKALSGLAEGTTYHFRVVAENEVAKTVGSDMTFETPRLPQVVTEAPEAVKGAEAVLTGTVDPNGATTEYDFEYGRTTSYGTTIAPDSAGDGNSPIEATESIGELQPETTYHYRVAATSQAGTDYGEDMTLTTAAASSPGPQTPIPGNFFGMMWTGEWEQTVQPQVLAAVKNSGARILRLGMNYESQFQEIYERIFRAASNRGITILPGLGGGAWPTDEAGQNTWKKYAKEVVAKYGPGGSFWNGIANPHPVVAWEIWNEPNLPTNSPFPNPTKQEIENDPKAPYKKIGAEQFGLFFHKVAEGLKEGAGGHQIEVLAPGLFSFGSSNCEGGECHLSPANFLGQMGHQSDYDAVSLHPYVFKVKGSSGTPHAPTGPDQVVKVVEKIENFIRDVRDELGTLKEGGKEIWVTEAGFPVKYPNENPLFPGVTEAVQKEEIESTFGMMKAKHNSLDIAHAFYYNIQDFRCMQYFVVRGFCKAAGEEHDAWDAHSGLRKGKGGNRQGWSAYASLTPQGHPNWSSRKKSTNPHTDARALSANLLYDIETEGAQYESRVEWGGGPLSAVFPQVTTWQPVHIPEEGEGEAEALAVEEATRIGGLQPQGTYHYRVSVRDENGEVETEPTGHEFHTKPEVTASIRTLNGEYGWLNVSGHVESETPLNNTWVNVNLKKREHGEWVFNSGESTHAELSNGNYSLVNWPIGKGEWLINVVFEGNAEAPRGETGPEEFIVKNAYHLVAQNSGKCLEVSFGSSANGMSIHQEPCGDGHTQQAQAFRLVPSSTNPALYEIVNRNSGKCLEVSGSSTADGAPIYQNDCQGFGALSQVFEGRPSSATDSSHVNYIAQNSGKCLDVTGGSTANGALLEQWTCTGASNQSFGFESVEADPIPTNAYVTLDQTLYGHPGYETFHGSVEAPQSVAGQPVFVNFKRQNASGIYEFVDQVAMTLNGAGEYSYNYWGVGAGNWEAIAIYPGSGLMAESRSPEGAHRFHVGDGYRFEFRQSNQCVSTNGGGTANGTAILQWPCSPNPSAGDGQVYSVEPVAPVGGNYFRIRPDSATGQCLDVAGGPGATQNGAVIQLWNCFEPPATNQVWHIVELPNTGWFAFLAQNSGRCMTVNENSLTPGARFLMWDCAWAGSQQWRWLPVG